MQLRETKCPNCAGTLQFSSDNRKKICPYCDSEFIIQPETKDKNERIQESVSTPVKYQNPTEAVKAICANAAIDSLYCKAGSSLRGSKIFNKAKRNFGIADGEDAYLIFDNTVFGSCKTGFAVCTNGFYYSADGLNPYVISWDNFKNVRIVRKKGNLCVGDEEYITSSDSEEIFAILKKIKDSI